MFKKLELLLPPLPLALILCIVIWGGASLLPQFTFSLPHSDLAAYFFWVLGIVFVLPAVISFIKAKTTVDPRAPEKSKALVINGLYKFSRNPMYVGFFFWLLATACFFSHILGVAIAILFIPYMNRFQIALEEQFLQKTFGNDYTQYRHSVRRWL